MTTAPSPLATPDPWRLVADGYVTDLVPLFEQYARDALRLAELPSGAHIVDVACGPGTLSLLAAPDVERVDALDFTPAMIEHLRRRVAEGGVTNVEAQVGDGQALPFADDRFDAGFSMFGLMFFPDRGAGFRELRRVLKPGGRVVVSSWTAPERVPVLASMLTAMDRELPGLFGGGAKLPLSSAADLRGEMEAADFRDVAIHEISHRGEAESIEAYWRSALRSSAPIALVQRRMDAAAFTGFAAAVSARLVAEYGTGPIEWSWMAHLSVGRK